MAATNDQVQIQPSTRHQGHKGSQVTLSCFCENSHWFEYELRFEREYLYLPCRREVGGSPGRS